jgi:hypothetical protein
LSATVRRVAGAALTVIVAAAGVIGVLLFFAARDDAPVQRVRGPGQEFADQGARHLAPGARHPVAYNSSPPTSGPHVAVEVARDATALSLDQVLHALERGNVVIAYGTAHPPPGLRALVDEEAGPFDARLAAAGQAVILARRPGTRGVVALAWRHLERVASPADPELRRFVEFWLGRGHASQTH